MNENRSYEGYKWDIDLDRLEKEYVLPLNDRTIRSIALANIQGRKAFIDMEKRQAIILPYKVGELSVIDETGHFKHEKHILTKAQEKEHSEIFEYMSDKFWLDGRSITCEPDDAEDYDTQKCIKECMENFLICLEPDDERIKIFEDILQSNPNPAQELIYNLHRLDMMHIWERHHLVCKIADINQTMRFYYLRNGKLPRINDGDNNPDNFPF